MKTSDYHWLRFHLAHVMRAKGINPLRRFRLSYANVEKDLQLRTFFSKLIFEGENITISEVRDVMQTIHYLIESVKDLTIEMEELKAKQNKQDE